MYSINFILSDMHLDNLISNKTSLKFICMSHRLINHLLTKFIDAFSHVACLLQVYTSCSSKHCWWKKQQK